MSGARMKKIVFFAILLSSFFLFAEEPKSKLAVMEIEDISKSLEETVLSKAAEYLRGEFVNSGGFIVIAKERQEKEMIKQLKKESHSLCKDKKCQIPLGQALSADTILRTNINHFGGVYTINTELIDLAKEATVKGAQFKFDGTEKGLRESIDKIVAKMTGKKKIAFKKQKIVAPKKKVKKQTAKPIRTIKDKEKKWSKRSFSKMSWSESKKYCDELNEEGLTEWKLPTIQELRKTVTKCSKSMEKGECRVTERCLNENNCWSKDVCSGCSKESDGRYSTLGENEEIWTLSELENNDAFSWYIDFSKTAIKYDFKRNRRYVICVNIQKEKQKHKSSKWSEKSINKMSWSSSKDYCEDLKEGGFSDWRLPGISELRETIKDCENTGKNGKCTVTNDCKSIDNCRSSYCDGCTEKSDGSYSIFGDKETFWSSTEISGTGSKSWFVDFSSGEIQSSYRVKKRYVRCTR